MRVAVVVAGCLFLLNALTAQQPSPANASDKNPPSASCGGGHTVDEYIAEVNKTRKKRNKNPLPSDTCVFGWCRETGAGPSGKLPTSYPPKEASPSETTDHESESSSKPKPVDACDPYSAVRDVEVGDFYYQDKSYRAALSRYDCALKSKPGDPGIYLRLGKTTEKLGDTERALREYRSSIGAAPDQPSAKEARAAITRMESQKPSN